MEIIYILSSLVILTIGFFVYKSKIRKFKSKYSRHIVLYDSLKKEPGTGRYGIIRARGYGSVEFREIANTVDKWIKIDIIGIYPDHTRTDKEVLNRISYNGWILETTSTSSDYSVSWFSDNSMRIRDEKIKDIIDEDKV